MSDETERSPQEDGSEAKAPVARPRPAGRHLGLWMLLSLPLVVVFIVFLGLAVTHRALALPEGLVSRVEDRANEALEGKLRIAMTGGADVIVDEGIKPRVRFHEVLFTRPDGTPIARLPELRATLWAQPLLRGKLQARSFRIRGGELALQRLPDGRLDLDIGLGDARTVAPESPSAALEAVEDVLRTAGFAALEQVLAEDVQIRLVDQRIDKVWTVRDGLLWLTQSPEAISLSLGFGIGGEGDTPARVDLSASTQKNSLAASFSARVSNVRSGDLAVQSPALAALQVIDAPISGALRSGLDTKGEFGTLNAVLEIGRGVVRPAPDRGSVAMNGGKVYLEYLPAEGRVSFSELSFDSRAMRLQANGQALLRDLERGLPKSLLAQVQIKELQLDPEGLFQEPAVFTSGAADVRLRLDPFTLDVGQLQLQAEATRLSARGQARVAPEGWNVRMDAAINEIGSEHLLRLWPTGLVPDTRDWVAENVATGALHNVTSALRLLPGQEPRLALNYEFRGAEVRILNTLPNVRQGRGFASIVGARHGLMVEEGHVIAPSGGMVEVADTVLVVPDVRIKPAPAVVRLRTRSPIPAALSLLDQPPFEFLSKANRPTNLAQGWADAHTELRFDLKPKIEAGEVGFKVDARLTDVTSESVVPGRVLAAPELMLAADRNGLALSGEGTLSEVPFKARWQQSFAKEEKGKSYVNGQIRLDQAALDTFDIRLPKGAFSGAGWADLELDLIEGKETAYRLNSNLAGIGLRVPQIGWSLGEAREASLSMAGHLGEPASVEAMTLEAPGLTAEGSVSLHKDGGLERARFGKLVISNWFNGSADLIGHGAADPDVAVTGGVFDLRRYPDTGSGGGRSGGSRISVALDRVQVSDSLALTKVRGDLSTRGGLNGNFSGHLNGTAALTGTLAPAKNGRTAVRVLSDDAGKVLAASGVFERARGGTMDMTLIPEATATYDGSVAIKNMRVSNAPVLASLLSAASVIGLLQQLNGEGILFSDVDGRFRLTPQGVSVTRGEAVGASMGVTLTGNYYPDSGKVDMQGVVSPFYLVNGIGQIFARKGEGLFGFNYSLTGTNEAPVVSVNPFSILTPGMFRDIFRRDPPVLEAQ
ncbi:AsmA-like C-terminal region-containing protein [Thioclava sp. A2]|uniref:AsmA-like C-terminal region-containing protein n=1 Tax=Thioclava sp. FCG-A2 TaxID=3080562 RepID=UPI0029548FFB|nr:AsmA-like C-terminal region-containing protein [Thioclava sp. A2]MDV7269597.1 AsmA-like C-terminal region-containing protein [Thioclava sp. A2]